MPISIPKALSGLGIALPETPKPVASYVPAVRTGNMVFSSGQLPRAAGTLVTGLLGRDLDVEKGAAAARVCALNALSAVNSILSEKEGVVRIVKLVVFVASAADFSEQPKVANGASDLMLEVFGEAGKHARSAVGVPVLPMNAAVEVEMIVEVG